MQTNMKAQKLHMKTVQTFTNKCIRIIYRLFSLNRITKFGAVQNKNEEQELYTIEKQKRKWIEHILRKPNSI